MSNRRVFVSALVVGLLVSGMIGRPGSASDWTRFRGPNGSGVSPDSEPTPVQWSPTKNIAWKTALPGPGVSSPIVVGHRVFVTCYSGYGVNRDNPGQMENLKRHLVCVDRKTGKIAWDRAVKAVLPEDPYTGIGIPSHGYASHTPVSDGERVYVFSGKTGALAFDLNGKQLWQTNVGKESDPRGWGSSSSPILYKDLVIVTAAPESQAIVALDKKTGKQVWRQEASGFDGLWGTPALARIDKDRTDLVVGVPYEIWGFDPATGKLRWYGEAMQTDQFNSSVVVKDGLVYAIEGRGGGSIAIKAGGKGDVTKSHVVWTGRDSSRFGTPVLYQDRLYYIGNGVANCIDAKTGKRVFQARLQSAGAAGRPAGGQAAGGQGGRRGGRRRRGGFFGRGGGDYASPVIADGKLYYLRGSGEMVVLKAGEKFEQLATNRVTTESETFGGTPAISNGQIFVRSSKHLYCIAKD